VRVRKRKRACARRAWFYETRFTAGGSHVPSPAGRIDGAVVFGPGSFGSLIPWTGLCCLASRSNPSFAAA
jgi:hypothetical protein